MLEFQRCGECGTSFPRERPSCPSCGVVALGLSDVLLGKALLTRTVPGLVAVLTALALPGGSFREPWQSLVEASLLSAGLGPLIFALGWLAWQRRQRDEGCFIARTEAVLGEMEGLEDDLEATDRRIGETREEMEVERSGEALAALSRELEQDRRLRRAQRRLVRSLDEQRERLEVERFRTELEFYVACRDRREADRALVAELQARIRGVEAYAGAHPSERWTRALEDARLLCRQLSRGVERWRAASRLDPLAHVELPIDEAPGLEALSALEGLEGAAIEDQTELQLERIDRGFDALDELARDLVGDADASGVRMRVDDEVMAALDEVEVEAALEAEERTSVV